MIVQSEFESLPEMYNDRTTLACDNPINKPKNRSLNIFFYIYRCNTDMNAKLAIRTSFKISVSNILFVSIVSRYPDIKSYDQTRVKLVAVDDVEGSDYINANYVVGYKERKRWICTQVN